MPDCRILGARGRYRLPYAVQILRELKDPRAIAPLDEHLLTSRNVQVKVEIGRTLIGLGSKSILPALRRLAENEADKVRAVALRGLGKHPDAENLPVLERVVAKIVRQPKTSASVNKPLIAAIAKIPGAESAYLLTTCALSPSVGLVEAAVPVLLRRKVLVDPAALNDRVAVERMLLFREKLRELYVPLASEGELLKVPHPPANACEVDSLDADPPERDTPVQEMASWHNELEAKNGEAILELRDGDMLRYAESKSECAAIHHRAWSRLLAMKSAQATLQVRRFLKARSLKSRAEAAVELEKRGVELSRYDRVALVIERPHEEHGELSEFSDLLGDVLEEVTVAELRVTEEMIQSLWDSGHPFRVAFALRWLGHNHNRKKLGKVAFDCLKSDPVASETAILEAFSNPLRHGAADSEQLALLLGKLKCGAARDPLIQRMTDLDTPQKLKRSCAEALGQLGDPAAVQSLIGLLTAVGEGPALRKAIEALTRLKAVESVPAFQGLELRDPRLVAARDKAVARLS